MKFETLHRRPISQLPKLMHVSILALACMLACSAVSLGAGNIFDDDWVPPRAVGQPHATAAQPPPAIAPSAVPPPAVPAPQPSKPPPSSVRLPIPAKADQAHSRALLKEVYAKQINDRSIVGRKKLAKMLLDDAAKMVDSPIDQFVVLVGAIDASNDAANLALSFQAADLIAGRYAVDGLSLKTDAVLKISLRGDSPATLADNVKAALDLIDPLLAAEDFDAATKVLALARPLAAHERSLALAIQSYTEMIEASRAAHEHLAPHLAKLKTAPDDPAANLAVGSFLCFNKGDWQKGLAMLAKGSDANLKQLATLEISAPSKSDEVLRLADGWWDVSAIEPAASRAEIRQHAVAFYNTALQGTTGLRRTLLERRIAEVNALNGYGPAARKPVTIVQAQYGVRGKMISVAPQIQAALDADPCTPICADNSWHGDPAKGRQKQLELKYRYDGKEYEITLHQDKVCVVPEIPDAGIEIPGSSRTFKIIAARYGTGARWVDVTEAVKRQAPDASSVVPAKNSLAGEDPHGGKRKTLVVWYDLGGRRYARIVLENTSLTFTTFGDAIGRVEKVEVSSTCTATSGNGAATDTPRSSKMRPTPQAQRMVRCAFGGVGR